MATARRERLEASLVRRARRARWPVVFTRPRQSTLGRLPFRRMGRTIWRRRLFGPGIRRRVRWRLWWLPGRRRVPRRSAIGRADRDVEPSALFLPALVVGLVAYGPRRRRAAGPTRAEGRR